MICKELEIKVERLTVRYDSLEALREVTLQMKGPGLIQILGPNGAGKTTLLKTLAGIIKPVSGRALVCGLDVTKGEMKSSFLITYMPQTNRPPNLTPLTVTEFVEALTRGSKSENVREYLEKVGLPRTVWNMRLSDLSGGRFQRVLLAAVLASEAPIVLLDEPLASIDPQGKIQIAELLGEESKNRLLLVTSHDPNPLARHTKLVVLLNRVVVACGDLLEVLSKVHPEALYTRWMSDHGCCTA
ncbi:MAG: ATP-binding cassette domain-containing protein [Acidilobaceae archaeon]